MPHVEMPDAAFIREESSEFKEHGALSPTELTKILEDRGEGIIGSGGESLIVPIEGRNNLVAAYAYHGMNPKEARSSFYKHRIYSTLFPHNFPRFYAAIGRDQPDAKYGKYRDVAVSGTIRSRLVRPPFLKRVLRFVHAPDFETKYPFTRVLETCRKEGIPYPLLDIGGPNIIKGSDGGEYYVDGSISVSKLEIEGADVDKLMAYMDQNGYSAEDKRLVRLSLGRLKKLYKEDEDTKKEKSDSKK